MELVHSVSYLPLTASSEVVTPVKTGVQVFCSEPEALVSGFRRKDTKHTALTFCEPIVLRPQQPFSLPAP